MNAVLGIDTSCYRTSLALASGGAVVAERRRLLDVKAGNRGMRQSDALFHHVERLGRLMEELRAEAPDAKITCVCASTRPRPVEGSYMPVFLAGEMAARMVASAMNVPLFATSHQQGHVRAALIGSEMPAGDFLAVHLSGGTTELLRVGDGLSIELIGGTSDLNAGQLVDRVGVKLGLPFPAGEALEALAKDHAPRHVMPTAMRDLTLSLSGGEAQAIRMLDAGAEPGQVAIEVYSLIARSIAKLIAAGVRRTGLGDVLMGGGVAASEILRRMLPERIKRLSVPARLIWGEARWSGDNAAGVALIGAQAYENQTSNTQEAIQ